MGNLILLVIVGTAAGFIATRMFKLELGVPQTIAIGVLGAVIGGWLLRLLLAALGIFAGLLGAILGAVVLIVLYQKFIAKK
ncbi:MAG: GlsB/YeaQ/YmgE family stress response membrane protein [Alphaproteobacteria bacterium]